MTTKEKIFNKALKFFNEHGIEFTGIRELAKELNISPGNLAYHFPKKEDLINEVALRLNTLNSETLAPVNNESASIYKFMSQMRVVYHNHLQFRCLLLSSVKMIMQYPEIAERYKKTLKLRHEILYRGMLQLRKNGYLKSTFTEGEMKEFVAALSIIARFWLADAFNQRRETGEQLVNYYLKVAASLFKPYLTAKGKKEMDTFIGELGK